MAEEAGENSCSKCHYGMAEALPPQGCSE
jgi:hypothetical protein